MRWENLFADFEAQLASAGLLEQEAQVAELARAEAAGIGLPERLRGHGGARLDLVLRGGMRINARITQIAATWIAVEAGPHAVLVPFGGIVTVGGLGRAALPETSTVRRSLSLASGLRAIARDRSAVTCFIDAGGSEPLAIAGRLDTVGADYVEVAVLRGLDGADAYAPRSAHGLLALPFAALIAVRSGG